MMIKVQSQAPCNLIIAAITLASRTRETPPEALRPQFLHLFGQHSCGYSGSTAGMAHGLKDEGLEQDCRYLWRARVYGTNNCMRTARRWKYTQPWIGRLHQCRGIVPLLWCCACMKGARAWTPSSEPRHVDSTHNLVPLASSSRNPKGCFLCRPLNSSVF